MNLRSEIAYLKGLLEETGELEKGNEVWVQTVGVLERMTERIDHIAKNQSEILDYIEALDDDLNALESQFVQKSPDDDDEGMDFRS